MLEIKILSIGKCKEKWLIAGINEYEKRLKPFLKIQWLLSKNTKDFYNLLDKQTNYICLDEKANQFDSIEFSKIFINLCEKYHSRLTFVIGGAEGIDNIYLQNAIYCFSLSRMTFTHQMIRLIFIEQIYRSLEISQGKSYQK